MCLIDEFDKMSEHDRTSLHEAMEQQTISISKAGIVTRLEARCSVIAAANPIGGKYDGTTTFSANTELSDPILSRFDLLCLIRDTVDPFADANLAAFVVKSHVDSECTSTHCRHPSATPREAQKNTVKCLRSFVKICKNNPSPEWATSADQMIIKAYAEMRKESRSFSAPPIVVRQLESILRIAESHAKMNLSAIVSCRDAEFSLEVMIQSYVKTQYNLNPNSLRKKLFDSFTDKTTSHLLCLSLLRHILIVHLEKNCQTFPMIKPVTIPLAVVDNAASQHRLAQIMSLLPGAK